MSIYQKTSSFFAMLRLPGAFLCALAALPMLWAGLELEPPRALLPGKAQAEQAQNDGRDAALAVLPEERVRLLQASVDSVALGLGGALPAAEEKARLRALSGALSALTASLGADIYFTAWQGTRILHSPGNLDADGLDFAAALDGRGAPFVLGMEKLGREEGGFLRVLLPPQRRPQAGDGDAWSLDNGMEVFSQPYPAFCPLDRAGCPNGPEAPHSGQDPEVEQVVYVRGIPDSAWHIAAFLPARTAGPGQKPGAFSAVWQKSESLGTPRQERFLKGLRISGFSLAGLAGLLLLPAARGAGGSGAGWPSAGGSARQEDGVDVS